MSDTTQPSNTTPTDQQDPSEDNSNNQTQDNKKKPRTGPKRRKVTHGKIMIIKKLLLSLSFSTACVYCRRSHMTCDEGVINI